VKKRSARFFPWLIDFISYLWRGKGVVIPPRPPPFGGGSLYLGKETAHKGSVFLFLSFLHIFFYLLLPVTLDVFSSQSNGSPAFFSRFFPPGPKTPPPPLPSPSLKAGRAWVILFLCCRNAGAPFFLQKEVVLLNELSFLSLSPLLSLRLVIELPGRSILECCSLKNRSAPRTSLLPSLVKTERGCYHFCEVNPPVSFKNGFSQHQPPSSQKGVALPPPTQEWPRLFFPPPFPKSFRTDPFFFPLRREGQAPPEERSSPPPPSATSP